MLNTINKLFIVALVLLGVSCVDQDNSYLIPNITGKSHEVIVVMNKPTWDGAVGDTLYAVLTQDSPALPQAEPAFDVSNVSKANFENLASIRTFRNLVFTQVVDTIAHPEISIARGKWARQQLVVTIKAKSETDLVKLIGDKQDEIRQIIRETEMGRTLANFKQYPNVGLIQQVAKKYQLSFDIPSNYTLDQTYDNFLWFAHETPLMSQGFLVYWYPYTDERQLSKDSLVSRRNQFTRKFVPGSIKDSYMTTDMKFPMVYKEYTYKDEYTAELRGLWYTDHDFMGGPFVSLSKVDEINGRIVTIEGFVYAPKTSKRNYVAQLEAVLHTLHFKKKE